MIKNGNKNKKKNGGTEDGEIFHSPISDIVYWVIS
jgi:hypothetical protein